MWQFLVDNFYLFLYMEEFANFLCDKCIGWKTDMLVFMWQIIFVKYQHLFVCMIRHRYVSNWNSIRVAYCLLQSGSSLCSSKKRSMRPVRWSSCRWKAGVPLFNAADRPQIQQLFAVSSTPRKYVSTKNCHTKIARVNGALAFKGNN